MALIPEIYGRTSPAIACPEPCNAKRGSFSELAEYWR